MRLAGCWVLPSEVCAEECWDCFTLCIISLGCIEEFISHFRRFADPQILQKYLKSNKVKFPHQQHNNGPIESERRSQKCPNKPQCWSQIDHVQHIHDNSLSNPAGLPLFCFSSVVCSNNRSVNHICTILLIIGIILMIILFCRAASQTARLWGSSYRRTLVCL